MAAESEAEGGKKKKGPTDPEAHNARGGKMRSGKEWGSYVRRDAR